MHLSEIGEDFATNGEPQQQVFLEEPMVPKSAVAPPVPTAPPLVRQAIKENAYGEGPKRHRPAPSAIRCGPVNGDRHFPHGIPAGRSGYLQYFL